MTPDKVRELEHRAITLVLSMKMDSGENDIVLHHINGLNVMANMVIKALETEADNGS